MAKCQNHENLVELEVMSRFYKTKRLDNTMQWHMLGQNQIRGKGYYLKQPIKWNFYVECRLDKILPNDIPNFINYTIILQ